MSPKSVVENEIIFIVGSGRSGTTFLAKLIDSHPLILYRHEPDSILANGELPFLPEPNDIDAYSAAARSYASDLTKVRGAKSAGHRPIFSKTYRGSFSEKALAANVYAAKLVGRVPFIKEPIVLDWVRPKNRADITYLIKSVNSVWRGNLYLNAIPNTRLLHIVRHPCAVIASAIRGIDKGLMPEKVFLKSLTGKASSKPFGMSLEALSKLPYESQLAYQWMINNQLLSDWCSDNSKYRLVRYEELCQNIDSYVASVFKFLGLDESQQTREFVKRLNSQSGKGKSYFDVIRSPISSIDKWQAQLSDEQVDNIKNIVVKSELGSEYFST